MAAAPREGRPPERLGAPVNLGRAAGGRRSSRHRTWRRARLCLQSDASGRNFGARASSAALRLCPPTTGHAAAGRSPGGPARIGPF